MFAGAKRKQQKYWFASNSVRNSVLIIPILPFGIVRCTFCLTSSSSSSVGCRAGDYELPPATTIPCQFRQLARANHVVCVSRKVLNVPEKQGSLPSWFSLPMWWNIQCVFLAWLIIRLPEYMAQKPQLAGSDIFY